MKSLKFFLIIFFLNSSFSSASENNLKIKITKNLRCLICQGQSIYDSDSNFANSVKVLVEKKLDEAIKFAIDNVEKHIQPISDLRGSRHYRLEAIKGLFRRLQICLMQNKNSLSIMDF